MSTLLPNCHLTVTRMGYPPYTPTWLNEFRPSLNRHPTQFGVKHNEQERAESVDEAVRRLRATADLAMAADPPEFDAAITALTEPNEISGFHVQSVEFTHQGETMEELVEPITYHRN